jgi:excisionase family DNA binding protein
MKTTNLMTTSELAEMLKLRPETIRKLARIGKIPSIRLSPKIVRYDPQAVIKSMQKIEAKGTDHAS